jgi:hypothetical protein
MMTCQVRHRDLHFQKDHALLAGRFNINYKSTFIPKVTVMGMG